MKATTHPLSWRELETRDAIIQWHHHSAWRARTGQRLSGISRMQADTHRAPLEQRGRSRAAPPSPLCTLGQSKLAGSTPSLPCLLGTPRACTSKGGIDGSPQVPSTAVCHTLRPIRWGTSNPSDWQQHRPLQAQEFTPLSPLTSSYGKERGKKQDKIISLFLFAFSFYDMNSKAMVCKTVHYFLLQLTYIPVSMGNLLWELRSLKK